MKTVGFIGAYDKIDLMMYIARILSGLGKKTLIIDATSMQKARYVVPSIFPSKVYITNFEEIDIAVGFDTYDSIKSYLGIPQHAVLNYDYIFLDIDSIDAMQKFEINTNNKNYFVSGFDAYSLKKGLEILSILQEPLNLTKVLFSKDITNEEERYFDYLALGSKAIWKDETIYFPFGQGDENVIIENQRIEKIKFKKLSQFYKESLIYMANEILDDEKESKNLRKVVKQIEKGV